jgi:hypothetical protein
VNRLDRNRRSFVRLCLWSAQTRLLDGTFNE